VRILELDLAYLKNINLISVKQESLPDASNQIEDSITKKNEFS
jgi:hypothetical protein